ncbi:dTDP-3-amino-3,6-dideoxy-alpha-D-galactopyranose transaminase [Lacunisphaera limnophila]|uniref:dTDP-3-amino-3,6-dideoxy-alpha-D-galactopyranose transaminase n=1 Tax=Lacunisphaera limnophila TaxID=1838286 RepID=A0A1D8AYR4_9BACT|nr:DegT/DnrJ/EryC1/StrS family aminotransferase [Lacunisphaera limnophila]AOS46001.1 dTDP-3-amino-3,6-dideoxy-alpha-D-galactopyranose transaminase [Lacunisphaera limnophila]
MKVPFLDLKLQHAPLRAEVLAALADTYDNTRFCLGKDVENFEQGFSAAFGHPRTLGMNSGTSPLHVASICGGFGPGDEIITTPFTFASSCWGISYVGATPVFVDIDPDTWCISPEAIARAITPKTKGIVVVHIFGQPARMDEIMALAQQHKLFVVEDCAQAVGARYKDRPVGAIGDCGTFSFYPTKNLGACGEGGAFVSKHEAVMAKAQLLRVHGSPRRYAHSEVGFNFRMDGFQGAILGIKLKHIAAWTARRRAIAAKYRAGITRADVQLPVVPAYGESVWHQFTLLHPQRDALRAHLEKHGIGTEIIYPGPMHRQECYASLGYAAGSLPVAEKTSATCLSLPIFAELTDEQIEHVIKTINAF